MGRKWEGKWDIGKGLRETLLRMRKRDWVGGGKRKENVVRGREWKEGGRWEEKVEEMKEGEGKGGRGRRVGVRESGREIKKILEMWMGGRGG